MTEGFSRYNRNVSEAEV